MVPTLAASLVARRHSTQPQFRLAAAVLASPRQAPLRAAQVGQFYTERGLLAAMAAATLAAIEALLAVVALVALLALAKMEARRALRLALPVVEAVALMAGAARQA